MLSDTLLANFHLMRRLNCFLAVMLAAVTWQGCQTTPPPSSSFTFQREKLAEIDALLEQGMADHRMPGAVLWIEHDGVAYHKAIGRRALQPVEEAMTEDTIFDAASLTKVLATAPSIMLLAERGEINLEAPVKKYIEEFQRDGKDVITIRQLLTHTSGLRAGLSHEPEGSRSAIAIACQEKLINPPGTHFLYSDINFILLGEVVQRVSGRPLA